MTRRLPSGFTLLELLVAITVLSIVSLIAWRGLDALVATRERLEPEVDEIRALLTVFGQMERDLAHIVQPTFLGLRESPLVARVADGATLLELARVAPAGPQQPIEVQTVYYRVVEGTLMRQASPPMARFAATNVGEMQNARLLGNVTSMDVRLWRTGFGWLSPGEIGDASPPPTGTAPPRADEFAPGVELTLTRTDGKVFRRVFMVGA
jgi:general secretion pathway protein J